MARPAMIFAAGFGTRMRALTADRPKPLIPVAGRTLLDRALDLAEAEGARPIVVNAHYRAGQIARHLEARPGIALSTEWPEILDTGGGLRQALPLLGEGAVFTLNPDAVWTGPSPFRTLESAWQPGRMGALLLLSPVERTTGHAGRGDFAMEHEGRIARGGPLVYTGAQIIDTSAVTGIDAPAFSLNLVWDALALRGRLFGAIHPGGWADVGTPEGIPLAEALLRKSGNV